jgi:hypothetical protein
MKCVVVMYWAMSVSLNALSFKIGLGQNTAEEDNYDCLLGRP